jgi:hypothetical protein
MESQRRPALGAADEHVENAADARVEGFHP